MRAAETDEQVNNNPTSTSTTVLEITTARAGVHALVAMKRALTRASRELSRRCVAGERASAWTSRLAPPLVADVLESTRTRSFGVATPSCARTCAPGFAAAIHTARSPRSDDDAATSSSADPRALPSLALVPDGRRPRSTAAAQADPSDRRRDTSPPPEAEHTWVDRILPSAAVPYAKLVRLDRPAGVYLLAWPCFWSIALAAPAGALPDPTLLGLFGVGSFLLRGAGCTINDLWDRDIDKLVARTRNRPIASGAVSPTRAVAFLGAQLTLGLGVLLQLNEFSVALGAASLPLVAAYPLMKRVTNWPQAFLGLTFNWGALLGWAAAHGSLDLPATLPLYASGVCWTLLYDTVYAHQDKGDDVKVGVKSTALHFGDDTKGYLGTFGGLSIAGLCGAGAATGLGWPFYAGAAAAASHLAWQTATVDLDDPEDCAAKFRSNNAYGAMVFAAIVAGKLAA